MSKYYKIYGDENGGYVKEVTKEQVLEMAENGEEFFSYVPDNDSNYWGESCLIIKGEIVVPKRVNKFDVD